MSDFSKKRAYEEVDNSQLYDEHDLVNAVISALAIPESKTVVAETYANDKNQATEIQAYAKIAGNNWTFYVKSLNISIGRNTDNQPPKDTEGTVDIDLGPAKVVSRQHATINYNLNTRLWELFVLGRNGAKVDGAKVPCGPRSTPTPLYSGAVVDIGGTQMMFILPDARPKISPSILTIIGPKLPKPKSKKSQLYPNTSSANNGYFWGESKDVPPSSINQNLKAFQMFNTDNASQNNSPESSGIGSYSLKNSGSTSTMDNDLSKDEARDIKPPYSYATMITQAILSNTEGVLSLSEIYDWIAKRYAFYRFSKSGWQNSIRHNLSLNKAFEKVARRASEPGKGMKWQISESYKHEFLKKFQSGSLSKVRRGSSVSRQLQLHLAMHNDLPSPAPGSNNGPSPLNYQSPQTTGNQISQNQQQIQQHRRQTSQDTAQFLPAGYPPQAYPVPPQGNYGPNPYAPTQLPPLQPIQPGQQNQQQLTLPQPTPTQQYHHSRVSSVGSNSGFPTANFPHQPAFPTHIQQLPYPPPPPPQQQQQQSPQLSIPQSQPQDLKRTSNELRPITEGSVTSNDRTEIKQSSSSGQDLESNSQLSSPIKPAEQASGKTPPKQFQPLYYNNSNNNNTNNSKDDSTNNTTDTKTETNNSNMDFGLITSPTKSFSVSAVEAYTPERGARKKSQDIGNGDSNSASNSNGNSNQQGQHNNLQSSPALWNFVQFSTPLQPGQNIRDIPQSQDKQNQSTPTKGGYLPDSPLNLKTKEKDVGDLRNVDLAKGFKK